MRHLVSLENVGKSFGATRALAGVSFDLEEGEVHALVGENGAGKSTLMNILAGVLQPDSGRVVVDGRAVAFDSTHESKAAGIAAVFQELSLVDGLSVEENICAGQAPVRFGFIDRRQMRTRAKAALARLGLRLPTAAAVGTLLASQRQSVEIAKALDQLFHARRPDTSAGAPMRVLILDEPTSALNAEEKTALFTAVRALRAQGVGIIYISHHLHEVIALADRVTVLRDGATVWTRSGGEVSPDSLVQAMVGREVQRAERERANGKEAVASFRNVGCKGQVENLSFDLRAGEVLAVAGLDGSGREAVASLLAGIERPDQGAITLLGQAHPGTFRSAVGRGVGYVPDDRKALGLFLNMSIASNALSADLGSITRYGLVQAGALAREGSTIIRRHGVRASGPMQRVGALSGGNQQKVLFAKWLRRSPKILVIEEPTKGVDIGAKRDIHDDVVARARAGAGVLVVSSDLPEILELADRILVLHRGRLVGILDGGTAQEEDVMALASGSAMTAK